MKVLLACEESQAVTKELRQLGHEAYSCDIKESTGGHPEWHIQGDVLEEVHKEWDMIIGFPPCTHLSNAGNRWLKEKIADGRQQQGIDFFMAFTDLACPKVAIENPVGCMSTFYRKPDQIIQPYEYGDEAQKRTCLWLKGLPLLTPTKIVGKGEMKTLSSGKVMSVWFDAAPKGVSRSTHRSKTFPGIAKAMARQWTV